MTGKQLKNSILQLAIQGKLVPQDANDEPASALLARIRKEKEELVKQGKLKKKDLVTTPISDEEKPFEIPESWEWCRLKDVFTMQAGKTVSASELSKERNDTHPYTCYGGNGLRGYINRYNNEGVYPIVGRQGALCGCVNMAQGQFHATEHAVVVTTYAMTNEYWAYYFLIALNLNQYATATAQPGLSVANILETFIPIPPLSEQHRIVEKIEELMPLVEEYDKAQTQLDALNQKLPEALKKSILQEAIMGKLVPQDPNDEPASVLLQRIRKEKEELVKQGKLKKKDLVTTPISDEEKPFEIPESWEWVRISDIYNFIDYRGKTPTKISSGIPLITATNIKVGFLDFSVRAFISKDEFETRKSRGITKKGDILFTTEAPLGHAAINTLEECSCGQRIITLQSYIPLCNSLFCNFILSPIYQSQIYDNASGMTATGIKGETAKTLLIPLPPLSEQHRIVAKIEELFGQIQGIA
ncbi:MAG: restriction endonuclease subunit S [Prevotella sp.]|nr:restriction endonuclease subunit S [Candidatus Prevotella equi]